MGFVPLLASVLCSDSSFNLAIAPTFIGGVSVPELRADIPGAFDHARKILPAIYSAALVLDRLLWEFGHCSIVNSQEPVDIQVFILALH